MIEPGRQAAADAPVLLAEHATTSGHVLAVAVLNSERTLNSLSLPMIQILAPALDGWARRPEVTCVLLRGSGDRAFCAGGDLQALYASMSRNHAAGTEVDGYAAEFFAAEYRLDYQLHTFPRPVIALGHGAVMGGGLGIFSAARFRLVNGTSRIAMPEVAIGLFPDAGGSRVLKDLPTPCALFLGATGSPVSGSDALHCGLATHALAEDWRALTDGLLKLDWRADGSDARRIDAWLRERPAALPPGPLEAHRTLLAEHLPDLPPDPPSLARGVRSLRGRHPWLDRGITAMDKGCPTSVGILLEQLRRVPGQTLADSFRMEITIATHCARNPDFREGIRALIIDKDNSPSWRYSGVEDLPPGYVESHFEAPWDRNPLADLENS